MKYPQGEIKRQAVVVPGGLQSVINRLESPSTWAAAVPLGKAREPKHKGAVGNRRVTVRLELRCGPSQDRMLESVYCALNPHKKRKKRKSNPQNFITEYLKTFTPRGHNHTQQPLNKKLLMILFFHPFLSPTNFNRRFSGMYVLRDHV